MSNETDIVEAVDEIVDDLDVDRLEDEAERLGITPADLLKRVVSETQARLTGLAQ